MFDKIKQKLHSSDSDTDSTSTSQHKPSINEPSARHQSSGSVDAEDQPGRLSVAGDDRGRSNLSADNSRAASRSRSRNRDVFWKSSLYDDGAAPQTHKQDPNLRAKSLSVAAPHPTMAEEEMKRMPYTDWSKK